MHSVGKPKHVRVMAGALEGEEFIGPRAEVGLSLSKDLKWQEYRGLLKLRYPIEHGIVNHWDDMERIWAHVYSKEQLQINSEGLLHL
jgi:centractin